ncbi:hypothetical protein, partial [Ruegeria conchae]|uniref:hypothetical protein n=1 Tax=Ruegeria conchae TaxID=981384 RepID=UPI001C7D03C4
AHRLSDASQPSLRPVSAVPSVPATTSAAPVKGVLCLTHSTRKWKIQESRKKLQFRFLYQYINNLRTINLTENC